MKLKEINKNFLNNQNYIIWNKEKVKILEELLKNKDESILPFSQSYLLFIIFVILYYIFKEDITTKLINFLNNINPTYLFLNEFIKNDFIVIILIIFSLYMYITQHFRLFKIIKKWNVLIYKNKIWKIELKYNKKNMEEYFSNKNKIKEYYTIKSNISKLNL